ncbi:serine acetyltransferase [Aestuariibacter halophilus]|uniref:Serine acetyltransferase n=1 Tax=Fluctibacter halophilus TaxID=226011 RepID=A0ABS8GCT2_9ALTE|nr:DapH/DapD/GlmU-related protein [Aestuariibacter halophilus]MCC2618342.1 serine acetyltransferase [Aestuariibacter halophilus]
MGRILLSIFRVVNFLHRKKVPVLPSVINLLFIRLLFGCQIGNGAQLGKGVSLGYGGLGIVIHGRSKLGNYVNIGTGVTIGGTNKQTDVPIIGDNTMIATGAKVLGPVTIGRNCVIGANAVVLSSIPDNSVAVGIPAKVIKQDIDISDYR